MIHIDIIEHCNFKCYFCAAKDITSPRFMDVSLFKRIVKEAAECGVTEINLVPIKGEPFLHPHIYEMLDYANTHMKAVNLFSNATAINVDKLKQVNLSNTVLNISQYGHTVDDFVKLTNVAPRMWDIFHDRLSEMTRAGIKYHVYIRTEDYDYDYDDHHGKTVSPFDGSKKCKYHHQPKIYANGDITFCLFIDSESNGARKIMYGNLNSMSVKDALEHPLRYKFYDSQAICTKFCQSHNRDCWNRIDISTIRLIHASKKQYEIHKHDTDVTYDNIQADIQAHRPDL